MLQRLRQLEHKPAEMDHTSTQSALQWISGWWWKLVDGWWERQKVESHKSIDHQWPGLHSLLSSWTILQKKFIKSFFWISSGGLSLTIKIQSRRSFVNAETKRFFHKYSPYWCICRNDLYLVGSLVGSKFWASLACEALAHSITTRMKKRQVAHST